MPSQLGFARAALSRSQPIQPVVPIGQRPLSLRDHCRDDFEGRTGDLDSGAEALYEYVVKAVEPVYLLPYLGLRHVLRVPIQLFAYSDSGQREREPGAKLGTDITTGSHLPFWDFFGG